MLKINSYNIQIILFLFITTTLLSQSREYEGPDDPAGDVAAERTGWMT